MTAQQCLDVDAQTAVHRFEVRDGLASPHDREVLASMLDGVEEIGKVPGCVGRGYLRHAIRLSDTARIGTYGAITAVTSADLRPGSSWRES